MSSHFKPINIIHETGVPADLVQAVVEAVQELLVLGSATHIRVRNFGAWEQSKEEFCGVQWYLDTAKRKGDRLNQIHVGRLLELMWFEPWQAIEPHYDIIITEKDLYDDGCNYIIGGAIHGFGTAISVNRFLELEANLRRECVRTEALHEVGHIFGLIPETRTESVEMSLGKHCTNAGCTMRQGLYVPQDWIRITEDRMKRRTPFCPQCLSDLKAWFR